MIQEVIVTTQNQQGDPHIAPMGIHTSENEFIVLPFKPSTTLDNILKTKQFVINYSDDVRVFAGCLCGNKSWPLSPAKTIEGHYLSTSLAHRELEMTHYEDDPVRPKLYCKSLNLIQHQPFQGFNRAQYAVLEAAILVSRLDRLPKAKIEQEIAYLSIGLEKTAGDREREAWQWLMKKIENHIAH